MTARVSKVSTDNDEDKDGKLNRNEIPLAFRSFFSKADKNGHGFVTRMEMLGTVGNSGK